MTLRPYLTLAEVASELEISPAEVDGLVQGGRLPTIDSGERGVFVSRWALDAYRRRLAGYRPDTRRPKADQTPG